MTLDERRTLQLVGNKLAGKPWEATAQTGIEDTGLGAFRQITVQTESGTRYVTDFIIQDPETGAFGCAECKASPTANFTPNQRVAIPEISQSGAAVVTPDIPGLPRGTKIPRSEVQILVGPKWPPAGWPPEK